MSLPLSSSLPHPRIWFVLLESSTGESYKGTGANKVILEHCADIADFRDAAHLKNASILTGIASSQLVVYKNRQSFDKRNAVNDENEKESPLEEDSLVDGLGTSKKEALIVVVPSSAAAQSQSILVEKVSEPHPKRKQRWIELDKVLESNAKKRKLTIQQATRMSPGIN